MNRTIVAMFLAFVVFAESVSAEEYIHYRLGKKYREQGEYAMAKDELKKVVSVYPDNYNAYYMLGDIAMTEGDKGSAESYFQKALQYNPGWRAASRKLAKIYEDVGQYDKSILMLQQAQRTASGEENTAIENDLNRVSGRNQKAGGSKPRSDNSAQQISHLDLKPKSGTNANTKVASSGTKKPAAKNQSSVANSSKSAKVTSQKLSSSAVKPDSRKGAYLPSEVPQAPSGPVPADARAALDLGVRAYRETVQNGGKDFSKAVAHFRRALDLYPGYPAAYYFAGMIRRKAGDNQAAKFNFERAISDPEQGYNAHFYLAKIYGEEKNYPAAIYHYEKYKAKTSYEPGRREAESRIAEYKKLLQEKSADTLDLADVHREEISDELRNLPQKYEISELQIRIEPLLTMVIADTATAEGQAMLKAVKLFRTKKYDQAIAEFRSVLEQYPRGKVAGLSLYDLGICYMKLHDWPGAIDKFNQYRERFPQGNNAPVAMFLQAVAYFEMKKYPTARQLFQRYIQENRDGALVGKSYEKLGDIYRMEDQLRNADEAYELAARNGRTTEDKVIALFKRGEVFADLKNWPLAIKQYEAVIAEGEKNKTFIRVPDSYYRIADYYYREKKLNEAREKYLRVTRLYPSYQDTPWGLFQVGNTYRAQKQYQKAVSSYQVVTNKYPEDYWATQAEWKKKDAEWQLRYGAGK